MNLAPIAIFVYNRLDHFKKVIESLEKNFIAEKSVIFIFSDGPKKFASKDEIELITKIRNYCKTINGFKQVKIIEQFENKGLANSIIDGVSLVIKQYGKIIVLEDDIISEIGFINYMNDALFRYEKEEKVGCIHAWNSILDTKGFSSETFFLKGADCWGWGTWERSWQLFERDGLKIYKKLLKNFNKLYSFNRNNTQQFLLMLQQQILKQNDSWFIRWHGSLILNDLYCLHPVIAIVKNIGLDGSGTHCDYFELDQKTISEISVNKIDIIENEYFFTCFGKKSILLKLKQNLVLIYNHLLILKLKI